MADELNSPSFSFNIDTPGMGNPQILEDLFSDTVTSKTEDLEDIKDENKDKKKSSTTTPSTTKTPLKKEEYKKE